MRLYRQAWKCRSTTPNLTGDAPVYPDMLAKVDPTVRKWLPNVGDSNNLFVNAAWWDTRLVELTRRFQEWLLT